MTLSFIGIAGDAEATRWQEGEGEVRRKRAKQARRRERRALKAAGIEYMPRSEDEYMRLPQKFSAKTTALTVMGCMAICTALCLVSNLAFANFSSRDFSPDEFSVMGLSLNYSPC